MISIHKTVLFLLCLGLLFSLPAQTEADSTEAPLRFLAAGDVMLGSWAQEVILEKGWQYPFVHLDSLISGADIFFANLEAPFGKGGEPFEKAYTYQIKTEMVQTLTAGKIDMVGLANNHILDFGGEVLQQTRELLAHHGIAFSGAGRNLSEAREPAILERNGLKIALAAYSLTFPEEFWATDTSAGTCFPYDTFFYDDIRKFKQENDLVLVSFHWGSELMTTPKEYQVQLAHQTIDAGADLVVGHHPHVIQGIEIYRGKLIAYSLGNFVFGSYSENARDSMLLEFYFNKKKLEKFKIHPINVYNKEVDFQPRFLEGEQKAQFMQQLEALSLELNQQQNVFGKDALFFRK